MKMDIQKNTLEEKRSMRNSCKKRLHKMKLKQHIEASKMKLLVLFTASYCFKERN